LPTELKLRRLKTIKPISLGVTYTHRDENFLYFDGWSGAEEKHRWTEGKSVSILFKIDQINALPAQVSIDIVVFPLKIQHAHFLLNNKSKLSLIISQPTQISLQINKSDFIEGVNELSITLPDAQQPGNGDSRMLALAIQKFLIGQTGKMI